MEPDSSASDWLDVTLVRERYLRSLRLFCELMRKPSDRLKALIANVSHSPLRDDLILFGDFGDRKFQVTCEEKDGLLDPTNRNIPFDMFFNRKDEWREHDMLVVFIAPTEFGFFASHLVIWEWIEEGRSAEYIAGKYRMLQGLRFPGDRTRGESSPGMQEPVLDAAFRVGIPVVERGGLTLVPIASGLAILRALRAEGFRILGVDGYRVTKDYVQPDMDAILDLSVGGSLDPEKEALWVERFLEAFEGRQLYLEFTVDRPSQP